MQVVGRRSAGFNATWNIIGGLAPAMLAVLLPPILIRTLSQEAFGLWAIILQVAAIAAAFGTVGQIITARFVAIANARADITASETFFSTALLLSAATCFLMIAIMAAAGLNIAYLLPQTPESLRYAGGVSLLIVSIGASLSLPGGVMIGHFLGEQRSHIPNSISFLGRLFQGTLILIVTLKTSDIIAVAVAHMAGNLTIFAAQITAHKYYSPHVRIQLRLASRLIAIDIWKFGAILLLWQITALVINGIDLVVLGSIDFQAVPFFAVAGTISAIFSGVVGSIYNAFLPVAAGLSEEGSAGRMVSFIRDGLRLGATFALMIGIPLILCNEPLLRFWVGNEYAQKSSLVTSILLAAFLLRTSVMMYVISAVASGTHGRAWLGPVLEAVMNLGLSIVLGLWLGATGVALGTLVSAGIGVVAWLTLDPLRSVVGGRSGWNIFASALRRPAILLVPAGLTAVFLPQDVISSWEGLFYVTGLMIAVGWFAALSKADRNAILTWMRIRLARLRRRSAVR